MKWPFVSRRRYDKLQGHCLHLRSVLDVAYRLVVRHHEASQRVAEWGGYCLVCHHRDGTEPEMDLILGALQVERTPGFQYEVSWRDTTSQSPVAGSQRVRSLEEATEVQTRALREDWDQVTVCKI